MAPLGRDFKCQIKPVLTIRRSPTFNCNILNPDKFTYKSHKPTCQSNKLHQPTTIHTLIFIIQRMLKMKMFYLFSLFVNWKMKMLNIEQYNQPRQETGQIHTHTHTQLWSSMSSYCSKKIGAIKLCTFQMLFNHHHNTFRRH